MIAEAFPAIHLYAVLAAAAAVLAKTGEYSGSPMIWRAVPIVTFLAAWVQVIVGVCVGYQEWSYNNPCSEVATVVVWTLAAHLLVLSLFLVSALKVHLDSTGKKSRQPRGDAGGITSEWAAILAASRSK